MGIILATQNPVDLDYKALSNIGTWFLGKLQTERDKARVLDGLEGLAGGLDRQTIDTALSTLRGRVFLMHNVHEQGPVAFETRWTLSYLRGPMGREELQRFASPIKPQRRPPHPRRRLRSSHTAIGHSPPYPRVSGSIFLKGAGIVTRLPTEPVLYGAARSHYTDTGAASIWFEAVQAACRSRQGAVPIDWENAETTPSNQLIR